ncbi:MAG: RNA polymerase subunit sigma-70, partial [Planctomycetes bacterium]|nr:RNA polymerase subunit sigma-70 [Planctomycetota bacterium]
MSEELRPAVDVIGVTVDVLLERARDRRYLTWEEMNEILPDEAICPDALETIMMTLESRGIQMVDEIEADRLGLRREKGPVAGRKTVPAAPVAEPAAPEKETASGDDSGSRRIDDPVRMYLTQMGEIPLLTRAEEIALAKKIELTRMAFRKLVLESDYCIAQAVEILQQVSDGRLPFDRTMKISTSEAMAKNTITKLLPENLATVRKLMEMNEQDFQKLLKPRSSDSSRKVVVRVMNQRRRKMAKLLEELSLRTSRIQPLMKRLINLHQKMKDLE